jgi:hypothetical protein
VKDILKLRAIIATAKIPKLDVSASNARSASLQLLLTNSLISDETLNIHIKRLLKDLYPLYKGYLTLNNIDKLKEISL